MCEPDVRRDIILYIQYIQLLILDCCFLMKLFIYLHDIKLREIFLSFKFFPKYESMKMYYL
jgi:hypothetical protein